MSNLDQFQITAITTIAELEQLKPDWDRLFKAQNVTAIFWEYDYVSIWWKTFADRAEQYTLVVRRGTKIVAIFPMMKTHWRIKGIPIRQLSLIKNHHVLRFDALLIDELEACVSVLLQYLDQHKWLWDVLYLENLPSSSPLYPYLAEAAKNRKFPVDPWRKARIHRLLLLEGTWDNYLANRSSNFRWQIKKFRKRLDELGTHYVERIHTRDALLAFLPELFALEKISWQGQHNDSSMDGADLQFCQRLFSDMPDDKLGECWIMRIEGRLVAAITLLRMQSTLYVFTTYYDPALAAASPGTLLYFEMLKSAWARGEKIVDFNGDSPTFQRWTSAGTPHYRLRIYSRNWFGRVLYLARNNGFRAPDAVIDDEV